MKGGFAIALMAAVMILAGCDITTPSRLTTQHIQVREAYKTETLDLGNPDETVLARIAKDYSQNGSGPVRVLATYAGAAKSGKALGQAQKLRGILNRNGVKDITVDTVSVDDLSKSGQALVTYRSVIAAPPEGCTPIPGYDGADTMENTENYGMGCGLKTVVSQMVASPEDLLGNGNLDAGVARRQGAAVEPYKSGKANTLFGGVMSASEVGQ